MRLNDVEKQAVESMKPTRDEMVNQCSGTSKKARHRLRDGDDDVHRARHVSPTGIDEVVVPMKRAVVLMVVGGFVVCSDGRIVDSAPGPQSALCT